MINIHSMRAIICIFLALSALSACKKKMTSVKNGLISFTSNSGGNGMGLFVAKEDGSGFRQLSVNAEVDAHSSWNYDGSRVVFSRSTNGNFDIWAMNADGTGLLRLTNDPAYDMVPAFSPDGKRIVFESDRGNGVYQIYSMNADGSGVTQLTNTPAGTTNYGGKYSPDGTRIAFASNRDDDPADTVVHNDIYVMNIDGTNVTRLTTDMNNEAGRAWSPDGNRMVFSAVINGTAQLFVINADGSNQTQITNTVGNPNPFSPGGVFPLFRGNVTPAWSPDGKRIAFGSDRTMNYEIFTVNPDGSNPASVTTNGQFQLSVGWQPLIVEE
jgi:TolB protein